MLRVQPGGGPLGPREGTVAAAVRVMRLVKVVRRGMKVVVRRELLMCIVMLLLLLLLLLLCARAQSMACTDMSSLYNRR